MLKKVFFFVTFLVVFTSYPQFDDTVPKAKLFDDINDIGVLIQTLAKDKLYIISGLKKGRAKKELDNALSTINESISEIDLNEDDIEIQNQLKKIKEFWTKFNKSSVQKLDYKEYSNVYFQVNTFERMVSDLSQKMFEVYQLDGEKYANYQDIQKLRKLIQMLTVSYYAKHLDLSKNFLHQYQKNIAEIDNFIKEKSNVFLNDPVTEGFFQDFILDWNFFRANLLHPSIKNPKTVFSLSNSIDYQLFKVKNKYIDLLKN